MTFMITIVDTLLSYEQPLVVTACGRDGSKFVGLAYDDNVDGLQNFALVRVDQSTLDEFKSGKLDLLTLLTERHTGLRLLATAYGAPGESAEAAATDTLPADSLPEPGMFMPSKPRS